MTAKVVSATFLLVCFVNLKDNICDIRKIVFYFTSKALFLIEIIDLIFKCSNVMTSSNAQAWNTKHILLNNLGSKYSLVMKSSLYLVYIFKRKIFIKKFNEKYDLETNSKSFLIFIKSSIKSSDLNEFWWSRQYIPNISSLLQNFIFPIVVVLNSLRTQKGLELVFRWQFLHIFLVNLYFCNMT